MKHLILLTFLLMSCIACDDSNREVFVLESEIDSLKLEVETLRQTSESWRYLATNNFNEKICLENKIHAGCVSFRNNLEINNVKLPKPLWDFCDQYEDKK
jgi:hypothetical protein